MQPAHPRRNPLIPIISTRPGFIRFGDHPIECEVTEAEKDWLNALSGECESDRAIENFHESTPPVDDAQTKRRLQLAIDIGLRAGALIDSHTIPVSSRWVTHTDPDWIATDYTNERLLRPERSALELARVIDSRCESPIHIAGANYLSHAIMRAAKVANIPTTADPLSAALIVFPSVSHPFVSDYDFVELERRLVRLERAVLVGEREHPAVEVDRGSAGGAFVGERRDAHSRRAAIGGAHASRLRRSLRMTSVSTRTLGMSSRRPTSSSSVGSMIGSC